MNRRLDAKADKTTDKVISEKTMGISNRQKQSFLREIDRIQELAENEKNEEFAESLGNRLREVVYHIDSTVPLVGFAQVGKSTWKENLRYGDCPSRIGSEIGYEGIESDDPALGVIPRNRISDLQLSRYFKGRKFLFDFTLYDCDAAGEMWKKIAEIERKEKNEKRNLRDENSNLVDDSISYLFKDMLPFFPAYFLVVSNDILDSRGTTGMLKELTAAMYPPEGRSERPLAVVLTKIDHLKNDPELGEWSKTSPDMYNAFFGEGNAELIEGSIKEVLARRFKPFYKNVIGKLSGGYKLFSICCQVTKQDQGAKQVEKLRDAGRIQEAVDLEEKVAKTSESQALDSISGDGIRVANPVIWMCQRLIYFKKQRRIRRFRTVNMLFLFLVIIPMIFFVHFIPWFVSRPNRQLDPRIEYLLTRILVCRNPYAVILRHFSAKPLLDLRGRYERRALSLIDKGRYSTLTETCLPLIRWLPGSADDDLISTKLGEKISEHFVDEDMDELAKAVDYYITEIGEPTRFPKIVKRCIAATDSNDMTAPVSPDKLRAMLDERSRRDTIPTICYTYIEEAKLRSGLPTPQNDSYDKIRVGYGQYAELGNLENYQEAHDLLDRAAREIFEKLDRDMNDINKDMDEYLHSTLGIQPNRDLAHDYEDLAQTVPGSLRSSSQYADFMGAYHANRPTVELSKSKWILASVNLPYDEQIRDALAHWRQNPLKPQDHDAEVLRGIVREYILDGKQAGQNYSEVKRVVQNTPLSHLLSEGIVYEAIEAELTGITRDPKTQNATVQAVKALLKDISPEKAQQAELISLYDSASPQLLTQPKKQLLGGLLPLITDKRHLMWIRKWKVALAEESTLEQLKAGKPAETSKFLAELRGYDPDSEFCRGVATFIDGLDRRQMVYVGDIQEPFYVAQYEVTIGEYRDFLESLNPAKKASHWPKYPDSQGWEVQLDPKTTAMEYYRVYAKSQGDYAAYPVVGVDEADAAEYCQYLSLKYRGAYALPTQSQWRAAAGGTEYPWGDAPPRDIIPESRRYSIGPVTDAGGDISLKTQCCGMGFGVQEIVTLEAGQYSLMGSSPWAWKDDGDLDAFKTRAKKRVVAHIPRHGTTGFRIVCGWRPWPQPVDDTP